MSITFSVSPPTDFQVAKSDTRLSGLEAADYSHNPFVLGTGTLFESQTNSGSASSTQLWLRSSDASNQVTLWSVPFTGGWHNIALTLDFDANTVQVYYSKGQVELKAQGDAASSDISNGGQYHIG